MIALSNLIRALARADWDAADALVIKIDRDGWAGGLQVIGAAFALAVNEHFGANATPTDVAAFVSMIRAAYQKLDCLPALEMEHLIQAALGEPELADPIAAVDMLGIEIFVLGHLLPLAHLTPAELDEFVAEAEQLAAEYM
ncbi:hypothetical protein GCM10027290_44350 [Micromonospora sonneratiae]|uniref:Uncharacterized protein n=1 Tax=Micromonospora sonneratiae TaxID=1184706 RepID=A0ABW3YAH4_9ACTN